MNEGGPSGEKLDQVFQALTTPVHKRIVEAVALQGASSFNDLLQLGGTKASLSQRLGRLRLAQLIVDDGRAGEARYRLGPGLGCANDWFDQLDPDQALIDAHRIGLDLIVTASALSSGSSRRIVEALSQRKALTNAELAKRTRLSPSACSRAASDLVRAGMLKKEARHPYVRLTLDPLALWEVWDWFDDPTRLLQREAKRNPDSGPATTTGLQDVIPKRM